MFFLWPYYLQKDRPTNAQRRFKPIDHDHFVDSELEGIGQVVTKVTARYPGRIKINGRWWFALSVYNVALMPGCQVEVQGRDRNTLYITAVD